MNLQEIVSTPLILSLRMARRQCLLAWCQAGTSEQHGQTNLWLGGLVAWWFAQGMQGGVASPFSYLLCTLSHDTGSLHNQTMQSEV